MNEPHDVGGQIGFGPVNPKAAEPVFHHDWEKRALGLSLCASCLGAWTLDECRHAYELIPPTDYLRASYYEIWIRGLETLLERHGFATWQELLTGIPEAMAEPVSGILRPDMVDDMLAAGPTELVISDKPRFSPGDRVVTRKTRPQGHTRLPRYALGKTGFVEAICGSYAFADANAHGRGPSPQWLYTVAFHGSELWGPASSDNIKVSIDAWETYLEPARQ